MEGPGGEDCVQLFLREEPGQVAGERGEPQPGLVHQEHRGLCSLQWRGVSGRTEDISYLIWCEEWYYEPPGGFFILFLRLAQTEADLLSDWSWWEIPGVPDEIFLWGLWRQVSQGDVAESNDHRGVGVRCGRGPGGIQLLTCCLSGIFTRQVNNKRLGNGLRRFQSSFADENSLLFYTLANFTFFIFQLCFSNDLLLPRVIWTLAIWKSRLLLRFRIQLIALQNGSTELRQVFPQ